jgi:hypothetical protein
VSRNGWFSIGPFIVPNPIQPGAVPVVERLLASPSILDGILRLGLRDQGLCLAAFHPLQEKFLTPTRDLYSHPINSGLERGGMEAGRAGLFKTGKPVRQLAGLAVDKTRLRPRCFRSKVAISAFSRR